MINLRIPLAAAAALVVSLASAHAASAQTPIQGLPTPSAGYDFTKDNSTFTLPDGTKLTAGNGTPTPPNHGLATQGGTVAPPNGQPAPVTGTAIGQPVGAPPPMAIRWMFWAL